MKDLDFDELDRAVNSLMSSVPKSAPVKNDDVKVLTLDAKLPSDAELPSAPADQAPSAPEAAVPAQPAAAPAQSEPAKPAGAKSVPQVASLAARRGGRFMDVVHPSSDMTTKNTPATATPARGVSRQGLTIEPRAAASSPVRLDAPAEPAPAPVATAEPTEAPAPANDWPDPLDMSAQPAPEEPEAPVVNDLPAEPAAPASTANLLDQSEPLTTPFLANAKVEKRPLGGTAPMASTPADEVEEPDHSPVLGVMAQDSPSDDEVDSQLPPEPVEADVPLPEELRGDLMAIESDSHPAEPTPEVAASAAALAAPTVTEAPTAASVPAGPSSIPQQYKEEPSTGDQTSGAIFDTAAYHQPLAHPAKKNSSWPWIIGIIVILLLGVAGGAALYFLGIA